MHRPLAHGPLAHRPVAHDPVAHRRFAPRLLAVAAWLVVAGVPGLAQAPTVTVDPASDAVFELLASAYPADPPVAVDAGGELALAPGAPAWDDVDAVAVLPDVTLRASSDRDEVRAFLRFAASPSAQRALIAAGLSPATVTLTDQAGRTVEIPQPVERIASPYSLSTYHVYAVGAGERLVTAGYLGARDPQGAAAMTRIDPRFGEVSSAAPSDTTSVEFLASVRPDLVLTSSRSEWVPAVEALGIPVLTFDGESPEALREAIALTGRALGPDAAARAEAWSAYFQDVLARVADATMGDAPRRVLFTGTDRGQAASGDMYQADLIRAAGGVSVSERLGGYWPEVGIEQVLAWDPDLVLVPPYGRASVDAVLDDPAWRLLPAVEAGRVLRVPKLVAPWDTPVADSVLAVAWLAGVLHPSAASLDCAEETRFFYRRFYDYEVTEAELAGLCEP